MALLVLSCAIGILTFFSAGYIVWLQFRAEQYDEQRVIDILLASVVGSLIGARIVWLALHFKEIEQTVFRYVLPRSLLELSSLGALLGLVIVVVLCAKMFNWPYLSTMYKLAWGGFVMAWGFAVIMVIQGMTVNLFDWLPFQTYSVPAYAYLTYISALVIVVWFFHQKVSLTRYGLPLFMLVIPQVPTIIIAIIVTIFLWYHEKYGRPRTNQTNP